MSEGGGRELHGAWKARFLISTTMLLLALLGMIVTDAKVDGVWLYWRLMIPCYALLSIGLSVHLKYNKLRNSVVTVWHEILHWAGLVLAIYLISVLINMGFMSRLQAGVDAVLLIALATFLAGIYIESTFLIVGILQGVLVLTVCFLNQYFYAIFIPLVAIGILMLVWVARHKKIPKNPDTNREN